MRLAYISGFLFLLLAGCASYSGHGLVPGQSTAKDVEATMGTPRERITSANGDTIWYYPHQPFGRQMYAVSIAPDGRMRSIEQTLTEQNAARLVPGTTTRAQARELIGPPYESSYFPRQKREVWSYTMYNVARQEFFLHVQFSDDGLVREVIMIQDYHKEMGDTRP